MKPIAAGCSDSESGLLNEDVEALRSSSVLHAVINPYAFRLPIARISPQR
jgi:dethiobiotin synthetase